MAFRVTISVGAVTCPVTVGCVTLVTLAVVVVCVGLVLGAVIVVVASKEKGNAVK